MRFLRSSIFRVLNLAQCLGPRPVGRGGRPFGRKKINYEEDFVFKKGFSLIETAIVIFVIGIILIAALKGQDLIIKSRIAKAGQLTSESPLKTLPAVTLWFEATQELSFKEGEHENYTDLTSGEQTLGIGSITKWYDRNPHPEKRNNATASSISQAPKYYRECINKIPCLKFDGSNNYLEIQNSNSLTFSDYSIFIVEKKESSSVIALLGTASTGKQNESLEIGYSSDNTLYWHQGNSTHKREYEISELTAQKPKLHTFINATNKNSDTSALEYYLNDTIKSTTNSGTSVDFSTTTLGSPFEIGRSNYSSLYQGGIGEIIILPFPVSNIQRIAIQEYLITKWSIK